MKAAKERTDGIACVASLNCGVAGATVNSRNSCVVAGEGGDVRGCMKKENNAM